MFEEKAKVYRLRETAKLPDRAHLTDAGMDFFFAPEDNKTTWINPGGSAILSTGVKVSVPEGMMLQIMNKSGVAAKRALITGACVVDRGYNGEIFVNLHNVGHEAQFIKPGMKLAQGVFVNISYPALVEIEEDNIYGRNTSRGSGALGSTGDS
jgi:dUTP pyrophosphatase